MFGRKKHVPECAFRVVSTSEPVSKPVPRPAPRRVLDSCGILLKWDNLPYYVEIHTFDVIYTSVQSERGYVRGIKPTKPGYIYSDESMDKAQKHIDICLDVAWKLNQQPRKAVNTQEMVNFILKNKGL